MRSFARHVVVMLVVALALGGCDSLPFFKKDAYKSAGGVPPLQVPPDLTTPGESERNAEVQGQGSTTYSDFSKGKVPQAATSNVLPVFDERLHIDREGSQRWLVVPAKPEAVWPLVRQFWLDNGFVLKKEMPEAGVMETDWAEHRERVPEGGIRGIHNKVINTITSTSQRDKFRTRLERGTEPDTTEIYISHRGMVEVYDTEGQDHTIWQPKDDPEFEAEMMSRLMVRFGIEEAQAKTRVAAAPAVTRASLSKRPDGSGLLSLNDSFDRAWRRVGLALDRIGFTVEDRDRSQGLYFVRYADPEVSDYRKKKGWLDKLAFWKSDEKKLPKNERYRIMVQGEGEASQVNVFNKDGRPEQSETASRILTLLYEQLK